MQKDSQTVSEIRTWRRIRSWNSFNPRRSRCRSFWCDLGRLFDPCLPFADGQRWVVSAETLTECRKSLNLDLHISWKASVWLVASWSESHRTNQLLLRRKRRRWLNSPTPTSVVLFVLFLWSTSCLCLSLTLRCCFCLISHSISNYTPKVGEKDTQRAIRQAFNVWQAVTPLSFQVGPLLWCHQGDVTLSVLVKLNRSSVPKQSNSKQRVSHLNR